jgi:hypothetical protein
MWSVVGIFIFFAVLGLAIKNRNRQLRILGITLFIFFMLLIVFMVIISVVQFFGALFYR